MNDKSELSLEEKQILIYINSLQMQPSPEYVPHKYCLLYMDAVINGKKADELNAQIVSLVDRGIINRKLVLEDRPHLRIWRGRLADRFRDLIPNLLDDT